MNRETPALDHEELRDLCAAYALGALDPSESAQFESHLRTGCEVCRSEIEEHRRSVGALGTLLEERTPPGTAEDRLADLLAPPKSEDEGYTGGWTAPNSIGRSRLLWAASVLLLVLPTLWVALTARREVARLEVLLEEFESATDPIVSTYDLVPEPEAAGARIRATFDPRTDTWGLFAHDLAEPPKGMTYQAWFVAAEESFNFGTFLPDGTGHAVLVLKFTSNARDIRIAVTLEPQGGSLKPTGTSVFGHPQQ